MPRSPRSNPQTATVTGEARAKAIQALQLRMSGATLQQIADRLGYAGTSSVHLALKRTLDAEASEGVADYRTFHIARLERLLLGVWNAAIQGDPMASQQALRILVEVGKIVGVAAPIRVEASGPAGGPIQQHMTFEPDADWVRRYTQAWEEVASANALPIGEPHD